MSDRLRDAARARKWNVEPAAWDVAVLIAQRLDLCERTEWSGDEDIAEIADEVAVALAAKPQHSPSDEERARTILAQVCGCEPCWDCSNPLGAIAAALAAKGREERERCAHACEEAFLPAAAAVVRALDDTGQESAGGA